MDRVSVKLNIQKHSQHMDREKTQIQAKPGITYEHKLSGIAYLHAHSYVRSQPEKAPIELRPQRPARDTREKEGVQPANLAQCLGQIIRPPARDA